MRKGLATELYGAEWTLGTLACSWPGCRPGREGSLLISPLQGWKVAGGGNGVSIGVKAALAWLLLLAVMLVNGAARVLLLQPRLGEDLARQCASLTGVAWVLLVSWLLVRGSPEASTSQLWWVGVGWLAATVAFEVLFGRYLSGMSWDALLADYAILRGRLWALILVSVCLGPRLWGAIGGRRRVGRGASGLI